MVSRSVEKMILIALGLTSVVIVGVPVLSYTMETFANISSMEAVQRFANQVHNLTAQVDQGTQTEIVIDIIVPEHTEMSASGTSLTISYVRDGMQVEAWTQTYARGIMLIAPSGSGSHTLHIDIDDDEIRISFVPK